MSYQVQQIKSMRPVEDIVIEREEQLALMMSLVLSENSRDRDFWLLFLDGQTMGQIADRFGVSHQRVVVYAQDAIERLECNLVKNGVI